MLRRHLAPTLALAALASSLALPPAFGAEFPTRKPGIWETTMSMNGGAPFTNRMCFSPEVEKKVQETTAAACTRYEVRRDGAAWVIDSICEIGSKPTTGRVTTTGDFTSWIHAEVASESGGQKTAMTIDAKWLRACGPHDKPGAIVK